MKAAFKLTDLCDEHGDGVAVLAPILRDFGGAKAFWGPIATVKVHEDNSLVRATLEGPGNGAVLVVDGGGSERCALLGDQLGELAVRNGWAGIVVYGCVRDSAALAALPLGIKALAVHPRRSLKKGEGARDVAVTFGGISFRPGAVLYADEDGVGVAPRPLHQ